jgi:TonB family protein
MTIKRKYAAVWPVAIIVALAPCPALPQSAAVPAVNAESEDVIDLSEEAAGLGNEVNGDIDSSNGVGAVNTDDAPIELTDEIEYLDPEGALEKMPVLTQFVEAKYPDSLIKSGIEGAVLLELLVSETGAVDSAAVVRPLHPALDASALNAARKFKFSPARALDGEAVAVMLQYEYRFSLRDVVTAPKSYVNLSGTLVERGTRRPVADALVVLQFADTLSDTSLAVPFSLYMEQIGSIEGQAWEDSRLAVTTDSVGAFRFYSLPSGQVKVSVQAPDYEPYSTNERISKSEEVKVLYYVTRLDYAGYELVVYGRAEEKEVSRHRISLAEVKRIPGLGGDAVRVVQAMPGVARPAFGGTEVVVRGAPSWASRYYIDGMTVPLLYHMSGLTAIYPSDALDGVDFYPGGFSSRYGGAVAGVIEMNTRKPKTDRLQGYADFSMLAGALFFEGPVNERISFMVSGRRYFAGDLLRLYFDISDPKHTSISMAPFYWDYLLRTDVEINSNHRLSVSMIGSRDSIGVFIPSMNRGSSEIDGQLDEMNMMVMFHTLTAGLSSRVSDKWTNTLRLSGTYIANNTSAFGFADIKEKPLLGHLRDQATFTASDALTVNIGADIEVLNENMELEFTGGQNLILRTTFENQLYGIVGGYANVEWKPVEKLLLIPGIRYDYYPELDYGGSALPAFWDYGAEDGRRGWSGEPSLRISGRYRLTDKHTLKAATGTYSQTPEPMGLSTHEDFGSPDLPSTKAAHYIAGFEWQISDLISLDAQTYFNRIWDVARSYSAIDDYDPTLEIQRRYFSDGKQRMYGLELMLRHSRSEKFFGWISYTLARSETWSNRDGMYILSSRDEPHNLQLLGSWRLKKNWEIGGRMRFVSGKPTSPIVATVENENSKNIRPVYGERNTERQDPFLQLDMRVDKKKIYKKFILTYYVDLQNLLWPLYKSPELTYYNYNYTEKQKISMIPLAAAGVRAEF